MDQRIKAVKDAKGFGANRMLAMLGQLQRPSVAQKTLNVSAVKNFLNSDIATTSYVKKWSLGVTILVFGCLGTGRQCLGNFEGQAWFRHLWYTQGLRAYANGVRHKWILLDAHPNEWKTVGATARYVKKWSLAVTILVFGHWQAMSWGKSEGQAWLSHIWYTQG